MIRGCAFRDFAEEATEQKKVNNLPFAIGSEFGSQTVRSWSVDPRAYCHQWRPAIRWGCSGSSSRIRTGTSTSCTFYWRRRRRREEEKEKKLIKITFITLACQREARDRRKRVQRLMAASTTNILGCWTDAEERQETTDNGINIFLFDDDDFPHVWRIRFISARRDLNSPCPAGHSVSQSTV